MDAEVKLSNTVGIILLFWILAWTPYAIMAIWAMFFDSYGLSPNIGLIPVLSCKISAAVNVLVYGLRYIEISIQLTKIYQKNYSFYDVQNLIFLLFMAFTDYQCLIAKSKK